MHYVLWIVIIIPYYTIVRQRSGYNIGCMGEQRGSGETG